MKPKLIILAGADGSGKTTLASKLVASSLKPNYLHFNQHVKLEDYVKALLPDGKPRVLDRSWLCELPYGAALGRADRFGNGARLALERLALEMWDPKVVLCQPSWEQVFKNWGEKNTTTAPEFLQRREALKVVFDAYPKELVWSLLPVTIYDYTSHPFPRLLESL
ncbi:zeta toxin family protein [Patescibacteria group bacterium]|nr:zeta toxin family protein [Patescibacteria group bacterium]